MRTVKEINADLEVVGAEVNDLEASLATAKAQQRALWAERAQAESAETFVKLDPALQDSFRAKLEAQATETAPVEETK